MWTRRSFLQASGVALGGLSASVLLAACGSDSSESAPTATPAATSPAGASSGGTSGSSSASTPTGQSSSQPTAAPSSSPIASPAVVRRGGTLTVAFAVDPQSLDPAASIEYQNRMLRGCIHEALIDIDPTGKPIPWLAESFERSDPQTWVFRLRKGVKFHDGTPFDAEVVKFNIERMLNPDTKNAAAGELSNVDKVQVIDTNTVQISAKTPSAAFIFPFYDMNGMQTSPAAVQKWGADYGFHPVGTGPFKFVEYQRDVQTVVEANPDYWDKGKPYLERIIFRPIPANATRLTELRSGSVQIAEKLPFQDVDRLREASELVVAERKGTGVFWIFFNTEKGPTQSKEFRQAWNWFVDRDAIYNVVYKKTGAPAWDLFMPGTTFADSNYKPTQRDLTKAKELLKASGVSLPLTIDVYAENDPVRQQEFQIIQANAAEVDIKLNMNFVDVAAWRARNQSGDFTLGISSWAFRPDPDQYLGINLQTGGGWNWPRYSSPKMDELLNAQRIELDQQRRYGLMRQIAELTTEDAPIMPYIYTSNIKGLSKKVKGFVHRPDSLIRFTEISLD